MSEQASTNVASATPERRATAPLFTPFAADEFDRNVWCVFGVPVDIATVPTAVQAIEIAVRDGRRLSFVTPNVNFLVRANKCAHAQRQMIDADLSLADGAPLVALARLLGAPVKSRCAGSDVFEVLRRRPGFAGRRLRVFFFGGRDGAAEAASNALNAEQGGLESVGFLNPGHGDIESMSAPHQIAAINGARPDFLVVSLGAAKGQNWIDRNLATLDAPVISHLGAVVDFVAGGVARAPKLIQRLGLEWAWRIKEDRSLWRRYYDDGVALGALALTRLLPAMQASRRRRAGVPAMATMEKGRDGLTVRLAGDLTAEHLASVRTAFREAAATGASVTVDLAKSGGIDGAFLGLLLMLDRACRKRRAALSLTGVDKARRRELAAFGIAIPERRADDESAAEAAIAAVG